MWLAFIIFITVQGQVQFASSPTPYATQQACVEANVAVEKKLMKNAEAGKEISRYHFDCVDVSKFIRPGLDV